MKAIPLPLIKANQAGIVLFVILFYVMQEPSWIYVLFLLQLISFVFGVRANLLMRAAGFLFSKSWLQKAETQAAEPARFNQTLAVILLGLASVSCLLRWSVPAFIFSGMVALAALVAVLGYCIGCTIYFQYKRWKLMRSRTNSQ